VAPFPSDVVNRRRPSCVNALTQAQGVASLLIVNSWSVALCLEACDLSGPVRRVNALTPPSWQ
jgi:hypothetical protein